MSDTPAPEARSQWRRRVRRFIRLLRHPIAGLLALTAVVFSIKALPTGGWRNSDFGKSSELCFMRWPSSPFESAAWKCARFVGMNVEVLDDGSAIIQTIDQGWNGHGAKVEEQRPVYLAVYTTKLLDFGFFAPTQRLCVQCVYLDALSPGCDPANQALAREAFVDYLKLQGVRSMPPDFHLSDDSSVTLLWGGYAWDAATLFAVGVLLWSLSSVPSRVRTHRARRAGLCENCRYPLAGLAPAGDQLTCPECGRAHPA